MDLLFNRYANPFILLDNFISIGSCEAFILDFIKFRNEELQDKQEWEFFLHRVFDMSWGEFKNAITTPNTEDKQIDLGATLIKSKNILNTFTPTESEV